MKKIILLIIIAILAITIIIGFKKINIGALTLKILEQSAHIKIDYNTITGNIFSGFKINDYKICISKTDSIYGTAANIKYRFNPLDFRFPNFFQIGLTDPVIIIQAKGTFKEKRSVILPQLHLSLRINVKNGKVIYVEKKNHEIKRISGLLFLDFVGPKIFLSTMNLSFQFPAYHILINSANINTIINHKNIIARLVKIRGRGIRIDAEAEYQFADRNLLIKVKDGNLNLKTLAVYKGSINFSGTLGFQKGSILTKIRGRVKDLYPFNEFQFETASLSDTVLLNIFNGQILGGSIFAQVRILKLKKIEFETNFHNVNITKFFGYKSPLLISGYLSYRNKRYTGFFNSPVENGLGFDSLFAFGTITNSLINIDSLYTLEGKKTLMIQGGISPRPGLPGNLSFNFNDFNLNRFSKYLRLKGLINGTLSANGDLSDIKKIRVSADINGNNFIYDSLRIKNLHIKTENFQLYKTIKGTEVSLNNITYKNFKLQKIILFVDNKGFLMKAKQNFDSLVLKGELDDSLTGKIDELVFDCNRIRTTNCSPIPFNIPQHKIDTLHINFIDGNMTISISPLDIRLKNGNLKKLARLLNITEELSGNLNLKFSNNIFDIRAEKINFQEISNAALTTSGKYINKKIDIDSLTITDTENQKLSVNGFISPHYSELQLELTNTRARSLQFLKRFLKNPSGRINGKVNFKGNIEKFDLSGELLVKQAGFVIPIISSRFDSVSGRIIFKENKLIFRDAKGLVSSTRGGKSLPTAPVYAGGFVKLQPKFRVRDFKYELSFKNAPVQYLPFAFGIGSGNFTIGMKNGIMFYNGNITLKEAIIPIDFGTKLATNHTETKREWRMNLKLKAERDIWLRNKSADIEFGGDLYLIKGKGPLSISGNLESKRGHFYWLNHTLDVTRGRITFIPQEIVDPELDVWAQMNTRQGTKIILHFFGPVSEPIFEFFTDPPGQYSEQDILTYLNLNITWEELDKIKQGEYVGKILPGSIISWLESDVSRRIRKYTGFDYFRIETPLFEADEKTRVTVGKYISRNLFITYTYDLTSFSNEFNVEYFLDDKNEILIKKDETGEYSLQYQYRIRF